jgi:hypothetical protein
MLLVGRGFDSLNSPGQGPVIRVDGLPHLPSMKYGEVLSRFPVLYSKRNKNILNATAKYNDIIPYYAMSTYLFKCNIISIVPKYKNEPRI